LNEKAWKKLKKKLSMKFQNSLEQNSEEFFFKTKLKNKFGRTTSSTSYNKTLLYSLRLSANQPAMLFSLITNQHQLPATAKRTTPSVKFKLFKESSDGFHGT